MNRPVEEPTAAKLGAWDAASIIVGIVIGTTIFEASRLIFGSVPNPWSGLAVWAFGGFWPWLADSVMRNSARPIRELAATITTSPKASDASPDFSSAGPN